MKRIAALVLALSLTACQTPNDPANQRAAGALGGLFLGAFVGYNLLSSGSNQTLMTLLGAAVGSAGGYYAADHIIKMDRQKMDQAAYISLDSAAEGSSVYWENQDTGSAGSFKVLRSFQAADGRRCREFRAKTMGNLRTVERQETACLTQNGAWEFI